MRTNRPYVAGYGGVRLKRVGSPRWPHGWDRKLGPEWTPIARIRAALESAATEARGGLAPRPKLERAHLRLTKEEARTRVLRQASREHEHLVWAVVWLLRWLTCHHETIVPGPRVPLRWGSAPTQVCSTCKAWRIVRPNHKPTAWRDHALLADALLEDEDL